MERNLVTLFRIITTPETERAQHRQFALKFASKYTRIVPIPCNAPAAIVYAALDHVLKYKLLTIVCMNHMQIE